MKLGWKLKVIDAHRVGRVGWIVVFLTGPGKPSTGMGSERIAAYKSLVGQVKTTSVSI